MDVGRRVDVRGRKPPDLGEIVGGRRPTDDRVLGRARPQRHAAEPEERDSGAHHPAVLVQLDAARDAGEREIAVAARDFLDREAGSTRPHWEAHPRQQLLRRQRRLPRPGEELRCGDSARAAGRRDIELGIERQGDGRQLARGVGVRDRAAHRAAVADLEVPDERRRKAEERGRSRGITALELGLAGHRPDRDRAVGPLDAGERRHPVEVHDVLEASQPQRQHRDEALPPGERLGLVAVLREQTGHVVDRLGRVVLEGRRLHGAASLVAPTTTTRTFADLLRVVTRMLDSVRPLTRLAKEAPGGGTGGQQ